MRWYLVALAILGMVVSFVTRSPGVLAIALLVSGISLFCAVFAFAARRIEQNSRPDTALLTPEVLAHVREKARRERAAAAPKAIPHDPESPQKFT